MLVSDLFLRTETRRHSLFGVEVGEIPRAPLSATSIASDYYRKQSYPATSPGPDGGISSFAASLSLVRSAPSADS